ncbi:MAG: hypothetical protein HYY24_11050 [Verrucomicrobia bacterium]|nr:hypothetical protein [Verrucomicrobiota bacterium]
MNELFLWFWTAMIFASIAWYGFLLFYVGAKGGRDIVHMTDQLRRRNHADESQPPACREP